MTVRRIVANIRASDPALAAKFYGDILGLDLLMDMNWIRTYGSDTRMSVQVSFMSEGGSGTQVPDLSIEVDDIDIAFASSRRPASRSSTARLSNLGECAASLSVTRLGAS